MADVFISYKREERSQVALLAERLQELGLSVWFDASLDAGATFHIEINREVRAAKAVVVAWSSQATESPWVLAEAQVGFEARKLAPVLIARCDLPPPFNGVHTLDLTGWTGRHDHPVWLELLDQIGRLTGRAGLRYLALAVAAGEPVRPGTNEAAALPAKVNRSPPKKVSKPPPAPKPERPKRDVGAVAEQVAADTRSGFSSLFRLLGRFLVFALKTAMVVAGGFVSLFVMRRWVLGSFATLGAIGLVGALVYSSWPETSYRFWEYTCERPVEVTTAQPAFDPNGAALEAVPKETETFETSVSNCEYYNSRGYVSGDWQSGVRTDVRFDWDQFWLYTLTGWAVGNGAIAALFVVTSWIPRSVREGVVRGLRRRDR